MFLFLSKFIPAFVYPLGVSLLLVGAAAALGRRNRWTRALCSGAFLLLLVFGNGLVSQALLGSLEGRYAQPPVESTPRAEAIVVLGGGTSRAPSAPGQSPGLSETSDRLFYAAGLYRAGKAPLVLFSGGEVPFLGSGPPGSEAESAARLLEEWGVPAAAITLENQSRNTRENAVFSRRILLGRGISRILLVTSAFHMPRAAAVFRKTGFQVVPAPADFRSRDTGGQVLPYLPNEQSLAKSQLALKEWLGLLAYRIRGWA